jgi:hypothetical protein
VLPTPSALSSPSFQPLAGAECPHTLGRHSPVSHFCRARWHEMDLLDYTFLSQVFDTRLNLFHFIILPFVIEFCVDIPFVICANC